jgi:antitoxin component HigA of HigAB toxin-antitoxin module
MFTIKNEEEYTTALKEMAVIFHTNPEEGTVEYNYYYNLVDAIEEYEHINYRMN